MDILRQAISQENVSVIKTTTSKIISSSCNLGALKLSKLCKELEAAVTDGSIENGSSILDKIEAEYQNVREALAAELASSQ